MSTKVTDLTELAVTPDDTDVLHIIDVGDETGGTAGTSKKIQVSNLLASAGSVDSVNGQTGVVVLDVDDLDDVNAPSPSSNDVLKWTAGVTNKWQPVDWLSVLYAQFKQGADTTITNGAGTASELELTATTAKLKTGISEILITETSPGDIDFIVATDATGSTAYTALNIDGSTTANQADIRIKNGSRLQIESPTRSAWIRNTATADTTIGLPTSSGTLALTSELTSGTVTSVAMSVPSAFAISGSPITTSGTLALSVGGTAAQYIDGTGALQTLPQGVTSVSGTAPIVVTGSNTPTVSITAATTSAAGSMSAADKTTLNSLASEYEETELVTGQNITMLTSVSVASNKIVDIMGDALADTSNANSKKFIGFHTGSGDCVLQGMVDAVSAISGATAGSPLWIGASGVFSSAAPTTTNYYSRVVGYFVGTGQGGEVICYFDPSKDWVQIS